MVLRCQQAVGLLTFEELDADAATQVALAYIDGYRPSYNDTWEIYSS